MSTTIKKQVLFVTGGQKTGTSTMFTILNCHPDIFLLYECFLYQKELSKYATRFIQECPELKNLLDRNKEAEEAGEPYIDLGEFIEKRGFSYQTVGDKVTSLYPTTLEKIKNNKNAPL